MSSRSIQLKRRAKTGSYAFAYEPQLATKHVEGAGWFIYIEMEEGNANPRGCSDPRYLSLSYDSQDGAASDIEKAIYATLLASYLDCAYIRIGLTGCDGYGKSRITEVWPQR